MGAASSNPRTLVVNNDSPAGLIDISDDVVQRLKSGLPSKAQGEYGICNPAAIAP